MADKLAEFGNLLKDNFKIEPDPRNREEIESFLIKIKKSYVQLLEDNVRMSRMFSESKKAEESLRFERSQLLSIFDSIDEIVYVLDPKNYKILYANRFMRDFLGRNPVNSFCFKAIKNLDRPCDFCKNEIILKNKDRPVRKEIYKFDHYNQPRDRWFSYSCYSPNKGYLAVVFEDITERKKTQRELEKSQAPFLYLRPAKVWSFAFNR